MDFLRLDLRYAFRALLSRPGFSAIAVITLALGIGVNTVAFSAINALLLRHLRVPDADRIGWVMIPGPGNAQGYASPPELEALGRGTTAFEGIAAEGRVPVSIRRDSGTEQGWALLVTSNYLRTLRVEPARGRIFTEADASASELPAVVSYRFWSEKLGAPESLGGQRIVVNGRSFSIIGVLHDDFQGPGGLYAPDMWLPLERMDVLNLNLQAERATAPWLALFARLKDGASRAQAESELNAVAATFSKSNDPLQRRKASFHLMKDGHPDLKGIAWAAWTALAVVGVVLLIACFNVAALLMARVTERQKEISIRSAVGASRGRILRQLVTEGLLLASIGGLSSLVVASWSGSLLATFSLPAPIPQRLHLGVDTTVIWFTFALVLVAGILPAMLPALQATRANLLRSMHLESPLGGRPSRTRNAFVTMQIAGSTLFIVAALLFVRSFVNSRSADTGFDTARAAILQLNPTSYGYSAERSRLFFEDLRTRLAAVPGISRVALANRVPFYVGYPNRLEYSTDGSDCAAVDCLQATVYAVGPEHFSALGIPLLAGREFAEHDAAKNNTVVLSRHMAAQLWNARPEGRAYAPEAVIGRTLRLGSDGHVMQVVGVAGDIKHRNMHESPGAYVYRPLVDRDYAQGLAVIVRTDEDPKSVLTAIREQVRALDPNLPPGAVATMEERMQMPLWPLRTAAGFLAICASLAVVLGSIGLFGVMYFAVSQRTREFGIRAALGATRRRVLIGVIGEGFRLTVPGVLLGGAAGYVAGRLLARALFGVSPGDPVSFAATIAIELTVALLACALPAYRATRVDPLVALRQ